MYWVRSSTFLHSPCFIYSYLVLIFWCLSLYLQPRLVSRISNLIIQRQRHNSTLSGCSTGRSNSRKTKWNVPSPVNLSPPFTSSSTDKWASSQMPMLKIWEPLCSFFLNLSMGNLWSPVNSSCFMSLESILLPFLPLLVWLSSSPSYFLTSITP